MTRRGTVTLVRGRVGPDGSRLCCHCGDPVPKGRRDWCGDPCVERYQLASGDQQVARRLLLRRDRGVCALCAVQCRARVDRIWDGRRWIDPRAGVPVWEADHAVPICEGGALALENLRTLCRPCHVRATAELRARLAAKRRGGT